MKVLLQKDLTDIYIYAEFKKEKQGERKKPKNKTKHETKD